MFQYVEFYTLSNEGFQEKPKYLGTIKRIDCKAKSEIGVLRSFGKYLRANTPSFLKDVDKDKIIVAQFRFGAYFYKKQRSTFCFFKEKVSDEIELGFYGVKSGL